MRRSVEPVQLNTFKPSQLFKCMRPLYQSNQVNTLKTVENANGIDRKKRIPLYLM